MTEEKVNAYLRIPKDLHSIVKDAAKMRGISLNQYVVEALFQATKMVQVPLYTQEKDGKITYMIDVPPEWYYQPERHVFCGLETDMGEVYYCSECSRSTEKEIEGCGQRVQL